MAAQSDTARVTCAQCSSTFVQISGPGRPRKFCSLRCTHRANERRRQERISAAAKASWPTACAHCGTAMVPSYQRKLCSNACKVAVWKKRHRPAITARALRSEITALKRIAKRVIVANTRIRMIRAKIADIRLRRSHCCGDCGDALSGQHLGQRYCPPCMAQRTKVWRRAAKARRRAIERGAEAESFDPFEIFERDKWRCHMCGCKTPKRLRGTYEHNAPELDHVVPLAAGGQHTRINTACSCRKCNGLKADKPLGQLRLAA